MTLRLRPCSCGSGRERHELRDAAGTFCAYVCQTCENKVRSRYNPAIFRSGVYAAYGTESALEADDYRNEDWG